MNTNDKIEIVKVAQNAIWAFWNEVAQSYPQIKTGDLDIQTVVDFDQYAENLIKEWLETNQKAIA
jgi:hypothetical protein